MQRLAQFDVSRQFLSRRGKLAAQVIFGGLCATAMIGLRSVFDMWAPTSGPFALIYPTVLLATLYGHWRAGLTAFLTTFMWAWYFILPEADSFYFSDPTDPPRVMLNAACALILLFFAEVFRRAAHSTVEQIRLDADRRLTLLTELEHRTKNNFALVASMLEIQKRRLGNPELHGPLEDAAGRVRTFADAYSSLAMEQAHDSDVAMKPYLDVLLDRIERAAIPDNVTLSREIDRISLPREAAVAVGLYLNEAVSNCLKYAFPEERRGNIGVFFTVIDGDWRLTIEDNGVGVDAVPSVDGGLGSSLMSAFAQQAGATHVSGPALHGYRSEMATCKSSVA
ncbi:sensor histidine kinase [Qipengyuania soli]|uniref:histidine kinase n=1 Tax=Qipengyuania soli TaxID=2782568 RepID=A0A7S8IVL6_9SPHN|nr:sensor histidine kinase [Qipengyuania soli]QPC99765.1 sensor histidine kinase [Qipengyuania soli]